MSDIKDIPIGDQRPLTQWWKRHGRLVLVIFSALCAVTVVVFAIATVPDPIDSRTITVTGFQADREAGTFTMVFDQTGVYGKNAEFDVMQRTADGSHVWLVSVPHAARNAEQQILQGRLVDVPGESTVVLITSSASGDRTIRARNNVSADGVKSFPAGTPGIEEHEVTAGSVNTTVPGRA